MPKEIRRKRKVIVGMVGGTVLAGGLIGGIIAISEILVQNEGVYQEKLNIFNWPKSYGAISTLLNIITPITGINGYISSLVVTNDGTVYMDFLEPV
ncbi:hypothetical protein [Spiroplasma endosymbiont of Acasis viretata]|uniref:hypothetical protein n=1 Tax=Spiroplasma endosymbiont of Acasis viretata TaxID=3066306 RepID=UPI00313B5EC2